MIFKRVMLGLMMLLALPVVYAQALNKIVALSVNNVNSTTMVIKVELAGALAKLPAGFAINAPPRIALDFPDTENASGKTLQDFSVGDLRSANIVQAGSRTRIVVNLNQMMNYETKLAGNAVLITLHAQTGKQAATATRFSGTSNQLQKAGLNGIDFHRSKDGAGRVEVNLSNPGVEVDIHRQGNRLMVDFIKTSLPAALQRKLDVVDFGTPVQLIDTFMQGDGVRMVIEPKGTWEHLAYQTDNKFIVEIKPVVEDPNKLVKAGYSGEKLTLNFQDISVREALNVIADFTQLNMVISDSVTGNLTLRLKDVPWDQALDIILQSRNLSMRKHGTVVQVAPTVELAASEKIDLTAKQDIAALEEVHTESFQLGYAKAVDVVKLLSGAGGTTAIAQPGDKPGTTGTARILSNRGTAIADVRTNTLFVNDTPSRLDDVRTLLKQIDVPVRQVMIEARFISASNNFNRTLGGKLGYKGLPIGTPGVGAALGNNAANAYRAQLQPNVSLPGTPNVSGGVDTGMVLSLFNPAATKVLTLELSAAEADGISKNIASPRVVTADQTKATISSGRNIPYSIPGTATTAGGVAFISANLSLDVTPHITPDNNINMQLVAKQDTPDLTGTPPAISTKSVTTEVLVENGGTVVVGGVFIQDISNTTNKVPLLGDIPVLGWLFKNNSKTDNKNELLIFVTPKIIQDTMNIH
jgi:type IV pilus assembly protein PilQ